jgi:hypothetical protein
MKKIIFCLAFVMVASQYSCKKFLDITPIDKVTGNNYYKSVQDVEATVTDLYGQLYDKYVQTNTAGAIGEFRSGEVIPSSNGVNSRVVRGDIALLGGHRNRIPNSGTTPGFVNIQVNGARSDRFLLLAVSERDDNNVVNPTRFSAVTRWNEYYNVIQGANILIDKLQEGIPSLSDEQTRYYIAEAKFIRNYCYFTLVRLFGDVVYYTAAYQKDPLPRENMVSVIKKCIADLKSSKNDLPLTVSDPSNRGVRASKSAVLGLLMNMNMWNAGFDIAGRGAYYQETEALGAELMDGATAAGSPRLLPITEWAVVTKGRSEESLFELFSTQNYNSTIPFLLAPIGDAFTHFPYKLPEFDNRSSPAVFTAEYMRKLYPTANANDNRLSIWFDEPFNQNAETFQLKKFATNSPIDGTAGSQNRLPDNTFLIMRYADAILLRAEALAELNQDVRAADMLNLIRARAGATAFPDPSGEPYNIKDAIFYERARELMGEGTHYFDLVRTRRITNRNFADNYLTSDKFARGGWTWPIDGSALNNNPLMTLNTYWIGSGLE